MSTNAKPKSKKGVPKAKSRLRSSQERRDDDIMNTNDSSIVSKRCVSKLYFSNEPDFYEPFVGKFTRRNPLINRGYWLRMHAIEQVVRQFLEEERGKKKVIVNLGCGYDPLPFQFWHRHGSISQNATFVDVDYPQLIRRKRDRMLTNDLLRGALLATSLRSAKLPVYLRSEKYMALGCDLRDLTTLDHILRTELDISASSVLFVAEVSLTYMPVADSDALIRWASTLDDARFCMLEQYLPQGSGHPFAHTMLKHFDKLQTPIQAVKQYPALSQQSCRFTNAGWSTLKTARNLWDLWSDEAFTPPAVRRGLDAIEPFDEWEEFALFSGHYFLLVVSNAALKEATETSAINRSNTDAREMNETHRESLVLSCWKEPRDTSLSPRRFGAAYTAGGDRSTVAFHGGQGVQHRLSSLDVLERLDLQPNTQPCASPPPQARICHTIEAINDSDALLVGGRGSPAHALADCWLINNDAWQQVHDLVPARFRHSAVRLSLKSDDAEIEGVMVFGGKASDGTVLDEWTFWTRTSGWQTIPVDGPSPPARFSAAISLMHADQGRGLLMGGMGPDGTVLDDIWEWHIVSAAQHLQLKFKDRTNDICSSIPKATYARIGASLVPYGNSLLLIGGVSKDQILSLPEEFLIVSEHGTTLHIDHAAWRLPSTWPLLVGTTAVAVSQDEVVIAGGGAVCFSMGSFWNEGYLLITREEVEEVEKWRPWRVVVSQEEGNAQSPSPKSLPNTRSKGVAKAKANNAAMPRTVDVPRIQLHCDEDFAHILTASKPVIIEGLDIGPCTSLWTIEYLKEHIGADREVVVHECSSDRMTFKDKNFQYIKKPVGEFLDGILAGSKTYLRAVSSSQPNKLPTKLEEDFPNIAEDFRLPDVLAKIKEGYHSSPLRISGPVSLWLHYDVLANVLCQVKGSKTLRLYPPSDVKYLEFPPGGSSSNVDVLNSKHPNLRHTHPHIASLKPGDILFLPPMWSHTATPSEEYSVAVNVFFKNLDTGYAAGKDVYGNRDLQAYENGRRDVERILKAFKNTPDDIARFYLERLAMEIQEKADRLGKN